MHVFRARDRFTRKEQQARHSEFRDHHPFFGASLADQDDALPVPLHLRDASAGIPGERLDALPDDVFPPNVNVIDRGPNHGYV